MSKNTITFKLMQAGIPVSRYSCLKDAIEDASRMCVSAKDSYYIEEVYETEKFEAHWYFDLIGERYDSAYEAIAKGGLHELYNPVTN